jgi:hypothetical protein
MLVTSRYSVSVGAVKTAIHRSASSRTIGGGSSAEHAASAIAIVQSASIRRPAGGSELRGDGG